MESKTAAGGELWLYLLPLVHSNCSSSVVPYLVAFGAVILCVVALARWASPGGCAWSASSSSIPGPRGLPVLGSLMDMGTLAHRRLAQLANANKALRLMALSLGSTRVVISSKPDVAREILNSSAFADRPLKQSAQQLLFGRAIGFAPYGDYWRGLRRIAANHLFSPKRIAAHEPLRQAETSRMLDVISAQAATSTGGTVEIRPFLQHASLNNIMQSVFGRRYEFLGGGASGEAGELQAMVREGFELLGAFNWADHLPALRSVDPQAIHDRCSRLVPRVSAFVQRVIDEHRMNPKRGNDCCESDFVDVLLNLKGDDKLEDADMIAVLWEMIFRGTDTTAILTEWILAELVLHPEIQSKLHDELDSVVGSSGRIVSETDIARMPLLQAVVKETLRMHPPGPLLSWARLAVHDVSIAGHHIPAGTTAMVNMWAITHDASIWSRPDEFLPERFMVGGEAGAEFDIKGSDLRLAPFGAGRRVCPGRALGIATVNLWLARLLQRFDFLADAQRPVDLSEVLKLSCEMEKPLSVRPVERKPLMMNLIKA